jgi:hypothetical protein
MNEGSIMRYLVAVGFLNLSVGTTFLGAQTIPGSYQPTPAECREAAEILIDKTSDDWRWQILASCGREGGRDLAKALQAARFETDPAYLERLYGAMANIRDPEIFAAALAVIQDAGASAPARSTSILIAVAQHDNGVGLPLNLSLAEALRSGKCRLAPITHAGYRSATPLPASYQDQLGKALLDLRAAAGTPQLVKTFVHCTRPVFSGAIANAVPLAALRLTYLCGNRYRVDNQSTEDVQVSLTVAGSKERIEFGVLAKGTRTVTANDRGTTSLYYRGKLVQSIPNSGKLCSSKE